MKERVWFNLVYDEAASTDVLENDVYAVQNFLTFATDHPNAITRYEVKQTDGGKFRGLQVIGPAVFSDESVAGGLYEEDMLFALEDVRGRFTEVVSRWFRINEAHRAAFAVYFGWRYAPPNYSEVRFQQIAQVVSLYHSGASLSHAATDAILGESPGIGQLQEELLRTHPIVSFRDSLRALLARHPEVLGPLANGKPNVCVAIMVGALAQSMYGLREDRPMQFHWLVEIAGFFWKTAILAELGFTGDDLMRLLDRNRIYGHLRRNIAPELFS